MISLENIIPHRKAAEQTLPQRLARCGPHITFLRSVTCTFHITGESSRSLRDTVATCSSSTSGGLWMLWTVQGPRFSGVARSSGGWQLPAADLRVRPIDLPALHVLVPQCLHHVHELTEHRLVPARGEHLASLVLELQHPRLVVLVAPGKLGLQPHLVTADDDPVQARRRKRVGARQLHPDVDEVADAGVL
ncbi:uncharacterized protein BO95DRAFT_460753 [Aspergillus brunneoviolaceus CBS 621.78]|uniref:Uncharacterized protein n=1 Tax=Aspergillus brunneoviolaceus CBS 621.78 TaxID=1450534 RepID=A0ACD1GHT7_9EURO|nr:hypothetical protein BO95DRAFT_460753 [Aspergillus brunneoviolaceus CBS 621.78]RAH48899.1 hypothetical protein BO95DRAFT_460753 [Aspergillus brunneoviolaceus CBS 621.78]